MVSPLTLVYTSAGKSVAVMCLPPLRDDIRKKKCKKQEFGPLSVDPYPPTIKREVLIRDIFDFFLPPTLPVSYTHLTLPTICSV